MLYPSSTLGRRAIAVRLAVSSKLSVWGSAKSPRAFLKVLPIKLCYIQILKESRHSWEMEERSRGRSSGSYRLPIVTGSWF